MPRAQTVLLSESELAEHTIYKILMQQSSIKGIRVTIKQELWHDRDDLDSLPPIIDGTIFAWISKKAGTVNVDWFDGRETLPLRLALKEEYEFKLISNANGGPPPTLRGAARAAAAHLAEDVVAGGVLREQLDERLVVL